MDKPGCECHLVPTLRRIGAPQSAIDEATQHASPDPTNVKGFLRHMELEEMYIAPLMGALDGARLRTEHVRFRHLLIAGYGIPTKDLERHTRFEINTFSQLD